MTSIIATDHASFAVSGLEHSIGFFRDVLPKGRVITVDQEPNQLAWVVYLRDIDGITFEIIEKPA